jgi:hypothetical protein
MRVRKITEITNVMVRSLTMVSKATTVNTAITTVSIVTTVTTTANMNVENVPTATITGEENLLKGKVTIYGKV